MKSKLLFSLFLGSALGLSAQGFKDGVEYYRADQPEEAAIILTNTLNQAGTDQSTAYYYLGQIALKNGDKAAAKSNFDKGMAANPDNGYNYVGLGALALADGNASDASRYFKDAKGKAKKNADILTEIARAYFVSDPVKYESAGMYEMAAQFDTDLEHPEAYVKYARTYFPVNQQYAIDKLKALLAAQPNSALAQRELAEKYYEDNQLTRAAEQYEKYIQNPNHFKKDKQRLVGLLFFAKRYPESYALASELLNEDPSNFYMQRLQFYTKKAMGESEAAKTAADKLFNNPKAEINSQDYIQYGELLQDLGQDTLAVDMYEKAVAISPEKTTLLKDLSGAYSNAKMYDKAADIMALARRYQNLAISYMETDSVASLNAANKALATIEKVITRVPDNPLVLNTKSDILRVASRGNVTPDVIAADQATLAVLDSDPANLEKRKNIYRAIYGRLGNYYLTNNDVENAKLYFQKFYDVEPSEELKTFIEGLDAKQ